MATRLTDPNWRAARNLPAKPQLLEAIKEAESSGFAILDEAAKVLRDQAGLTRAAIYIRVSLDKEDPENQRHRAVQECEARGWAWDPARIYMDTEHGDVISRDGLRRCLLDAKAKRFDVLVLWSLDRLARGGPGDLFEAVNVLKEVGMPWHSISDPIPKTGDPFMDGVLRDMIIFGIGLAAKLEQRSISERTKAGLARRMAAGVKVGRPRGRKDSYQRVKRWKKKPADAESFRSLLRQTAEPSPGPRPAAPPPG